MGWGRKAVPAATALALLALLAFVAPASAAEYLQGGDFEGGTPVIEEVGGKVFEYVDHPSWQEKDDRLGGPICSTTTCPPNEGREGGGTPAKWGPFAGTSWVWFGGYGGAEAHSQSVMQRVTLPAVQDATLSFKLWVALFARQASVLRIGFDQQILLDVSSLNQHEFASEYRTISFPLGNVAAGQHNVSFQFASSATAAGPLTHMGLDDVSLSATPVPAPPAPAGGGAPKSAPDTKITKVQLYKAKQGKTGSAKRPNHLKAKQGKSGKPAKAKFTFEGSGGEGELRFECKLDNTEFSPCTSPAFYKKLKLGQHTFKVAAIDRAGNRDDQPASAAFKATAGKSGKFKK
jgi:hypothetical protein